MFRILFPAAGAHNEQRFELSAWAHLFPPCSGSKIRVDECLETKIAPLHTQNPRTVLVRAVARPEFGLSSQ